MKRLAAVCLALLLLSGCAQAQPEQSVFFAMDTMMSVRLYQGGDAALLDEAQHFVEDLEALVSVTDPDSEIYALNETGAAELSPEAAELLAGALELCQRTGGALDISIYPVLRAWGFTTGAYTVPREDVLAGLLSLVDHARIDLDGTMATLPQGMEIDLGRSAIRQGRGSSASSRSPARRWSPPAGTNGTSSGTACAIGTSWPRRPAHLPGAGSRPSPSWGTAACCATACPPPCS